MNKTIILFLVFIFSENLFSNERTSARGIGMGRTSVVISRGIDAMGINPANIVLVDRGAYTTFALFPIGLRAGSDFLNYKVYNDFFTGDPDSLDKDGKRVIGRRLDEDDKDGILNLFPGGMAHTQMDLDAMLLGFTSKGGNFGIGFSVTERISGNIDLPSGYLRILMKGFEEQGSDYDLNNTAIGARAMMEYNYSVAYELPNDFKIGKFKDIAVGLSYKKMYGTHYRGTDHYNGNLRNIVYKNKDSVNWIDSMKITGSVDFAEFSSSIPSKDILSVLLLNSQPAGKGTGFDFGITAKLNKHWNVAFSVVDLGSILWEKNTKYSEGKGSFSISDIGTAKNQDSLRNNFKGKSIDTTSFRRPLPTAIHFGTSIQLDESPYVNKNKFFGKLLLEADMHIGLNNEPGNSKLPRFSVGGEYIIPSKWVDWLRVRSGMMFGGRELFSWAFGIGFATQVFDFDIGTESIALITNPNSFRNGSVTMGLKVRM